MVEVRELIDVVADEEPIDIDSYRLTKYDKYGLGFFAIVNIGFACVAAFFAFHGNCYHGWGIISFVDNIHGLLLKGGMYLILRKLVLEKGRIGLYHKIWYGLMGYLIVLVAMICMVGMIVMTRVSQEFDEAKGVECNYYFIGSIMSIGSLFNLVWIFIFQI